MTTVLLKAHAKHKNVFQDPEDDDVWYISPIRSDTGVISHFLVPGQSRYFKIPCQIEDDLNEQSDFNNNKSMYYPKYRSIWSVCPVCGGENTCASIYLKDTDVFVGHCLEYSSYTFGVCSEKEYISSNHINFVEDRIINDQDFITLHNIETGKKS